MPATNYHMILLCFICFLFQLVFIGIRERHCIHNFHFGSITLDRSKTQMSHEKKIEMENRISIRDVEGFEVELSIHHEHPKTTYTCIVYSRCISFPLYHIKSPSAVISWFPLCFFLDHFEYDTENLLIIHLPSKHTYRNSHEVIKLFERPINVVRIHAL